MHCCKGTLRPWENSWSMQDHCLRCLSGLAEAGRSLQGAGHAGCLQEQTGASQEQMPGLWWLLPLHSFRHRRWKAPSKTARLPVLCFPGGVALKFYKTRSTLTPRHIKSLRDWRGWHIHTLCASTAHVRPVLPWLVREKSSHMKVNCLVLVCLLFTAYKCHEPNLILYFNFFQIHKSRRDCMQQ